MQLRKAQARQMTLENKEEILTIRDKMQETSKKIEELDKNRESACDFNLKPLGCKPMLFVKNDRRKVNFTRIYVFY